MIAAVSTKDPWTGTPGRTFDVIAIRSPEEERDVAIRAAKAAVEFIIKEFGQDEAATLTINDCLELYLDL